MRPLIVTTSWDDGHVLDLKIAELLKKYHLSGTFYISPNNREFVSELLLSQSEIKKLATDFEIGAHTMTHPRLTKIPDNKAKIEIQQSKTKLESIIGEPVESFCYPAGQYNRRHINIVANCGFKYARTVKRFSYVIDEPLTATTTIHAYRHWRGLWQIIKLAQFKPVLAIKYFFNWDALAIELFEKGRQHGGIYHLWGHSWEIDKRSEWERLERVLAYISRQPGVSYKTNGALL